MRLLFLGDLVGRAGRTAAIEALPRMRAEWKLDFVAVNAENAAAGHRLCVPVIQGRGLALRFREWRPGAAMVEGAFGALIPATGDWLDPGLLIAPLVAFDAAGGRLGYGGGFYDRSLQGLRARRRTLAVGFAYSAQQVDIVPRDPTDQPLDAVVTEQGLMPPVAAHRAGQG